jgi:hypothetical protein
MAVYAMPAVIDTTSTEAPVTTKVGLQEFIGVQYGYGWAPTPVASSDQFVVGRGKVKNYAHRMSLILGVMGLLTGCICIVAHTTSLLVMYGNYLYTGYGFWSGAMFIAAGSLGIAAARRQTMREITAFLVLSQLSLFFCATVIWMGVFDFIYFDCAYWEPYCNYDECGPICDSNPDSPAVTYVSKSMPMLMITAAFVQFIVSVWGSIVCCIASSGYCTTSK